MPRAGRFGLRTTKTMIKGEKNNIDLSFEDMQFLLALYETQSLTQTAGDMRLSMGAASRRLSHVREVFGDELSGTTLLSSWTRRVDFSIPSRLSCTR